MASLNTYKLNLPIDVGVKAEVEKRASSIGLIDLKFNTLVNFLLINFAKGRIKIDIDQKKESMQEYFEELDTEYKTTLNDYRKGKSRSYSKMNDLIRSLKEDLK